MKHHLLLSLSLFTLHYSLFAGEVGVPIRPLAQDHVVVARSEDSSRNPLYGPAIIALPNGRLVATYLFASRKSQAEEYQTFLVSDDHGLTWQTRGTSTAKQGRFFIANNILYYLSTGHGLPIQKSTDNGDTWSEVYYLSDKSTEWHQTAANTWIANGNIYLVMEQVARRINAWNVAERILIPMRAKLTDDLTKPESWTFAPSLPFADILPGTRQNNPEIDYFGIPFYPQAYPLRSYITRTPKVRSFSPIGWVESNIVQITDPNHYWYDPTGHTFHILSRFQSGMSNYGALAKVTENPDGTMTTSLEKVPSGKKLLILPVPGGQMRFHISYDSKTKLYWLLSTQSTDSMARPETLPVERFDLAFNERQRIVLHFSKNLVDWCFAGLVTHETAPNGSRHYACMDIDGDDLILLSRSGDAESHSAHNGNLITFHRIKNFRELVY